MKHSAACEALTKQGETLRENWAAKWPNYCRKCEGAGGHSFYETHGSPYGGEHLWDLCECIDIGKCPRCFATSMDPESDAHVCFICGWADTDMMNLYDIMPWANECYGDCGPEYNVIELDKDLYE